MGVTIDRLHTPKVFTKFAEAFALQTKLNGDMEDPWVYMAVKNETGGYLVAVYDEETVFLGYL